MNRRRFRPAIGDAQADQNIIGRGLCVLSEQIEVTALVEHTRLNQFKLALLPAAPPVFLDQPRVGKFRMGILVKRLHVRVRRRRVEVEVRLLHILAMIAFRPAQTEEPLLEDRVPAIPKGQRETKPAFPIGDSQQSVLAPTIGSAAALVVGKIVPAVARLRIILAHGAPLALGEIRPPAFPVCLARRVLGKASRLSI